MGIGAPVATFSTPFEVIGPVTLGLVGTLGPRRVNYLASRAGNSGERVLHLNGALMLARLRAALLAALAARFPLNGRREPGVRDL